MVRFLLRLTGALAVAAVLLSLCAMGLYRAVGALPPEYEAALHANVDHEAQRRELESRLAAVYSDAARDVDQTPRTWEAVVTDEQINGWLATRASAELPALEEAGVHDPRVVIGEDELMLAFRAKRQNMDAVVMVRGAPLIAEGGRLGLELSGAWLGLAPLPTGRIVELTREALAGTGLPAEWAHTEAGRPVLLVDFETIASDAENRRTLTAVRHSEGELRVIGQTAPRRAAGGEAGEDELAAEASGSDNTRK